MHTVQIAAKVAEYFGIDPDVHVQDEKPVIIGAHTGCTWIAITGRPATVANVRLLKGQGVQSIEIHHAGRTADFTCDEIIRYAERPLLGGNLI